MANAELGLVVRQLHRLSSADAAREWTDGELLNQFVTEQEETAFAAIVQRYGRLVLGVCRRVLRNEADAEDAFQATFLVLARRARSICKGEALAGWLYGVAYHMASKAKRSATRRRNHERQAPVPTERPPSELALRELQAILDEEVRRLPETYRTPFVLCCLEGHSKAEAARRLRWKEGTVSGRLARARKQLQKRLLARGVTLAAALGAVALAEGSSRAAVPPALASSTAEAAVLYGTGKALPAGLIPPQVTSLVHGATHAMFLSTSKTALFVVVGVCALGAGLFLLPGQAAPPPAPPPALALADARAPEKPAAAPAKNGAAGTVAVAGRVLGPDGKPVPGARLYSPHLLHNPPKRIEDIVFAVRATTDAGGRFHFDLPQNEARGEGPIPLVARADGLAVDGVDLPQSGSATDLTLRLVSDQPIRGRVLDTQGKPVAGVRVQVTGVLTPGKGRLDGFLTAWKREWGLAGQQLNQRLYAPLGDVLRTPATGSDGRFEIAGAGGERVVLVELSGRGVAQAKLWIVNRPGFDGKAINKEVQDRIPARLRIPGQPPLLYGPDFDYVAEPDRSIEGTVREVGTGKPLAGVHLMALTGYDNGTNAVSDAQGRYRFTGLPKMKEYGIHAMPPRTSPLLQRSVRVPDKEGVGPIAFDIDLARGVVATGRVIDRATGKGVRAGIRFVPLPDNAYFGKPGYDSYRHERLMNPTDRDGRFRLPILPGSGVLMAQVLGGDEKIGGEVVNPYSLAVFDEAGRKRAKPTRNGDDWMFTAAGGALEFLSIEHAVKVIDSTPNTGTINCDLFVERGKTQTVKFEDPDGKPLSDVTVGGLTASWPRTFRVPSPACTILALDPGQPRELICVHTGRNLAGTVKVRADEKEPPTLRLVPAGAVMGRILDQDGQPVAGAEMDVYSASDTASDLYRQLKLKSQPIRTDKDGRFRIGGLVPGVKFGLSIQKGRTYLVGDPQIGLKQVASGKTLDLGDLRTKPRQ